MWSIFELDSPYNRIITKTVQIVYLNFLWLICCLPIVTIGASTTALYYVAMRMARNEEGYITKDFMKSFKLNFRQATILWGIILLIGFILVQDYRYFNYMGSLLGKIGSILMLIVFTAVTIFLFPVLSRFDNTKRNIMKTAFYMAASHWPSTLILILMFAVAGYGIYASAAMMVMCLLFGGAFLAYGSSFLFNQIFNIYIQKEEKDEKERE